ncbi:MAG: V-type ATPase subunit, partial [Candidatus Bathyarchaeota archaeon]
VKISIEKSHLLTKEELIGLVNSRNLEEYASGLKETIYGQEIEKLMSPYSTNDFERVFRENFIKTCIKIVKNSPDVVSEFLRIYLLKFENENIKTILRAVSIGLPFDEIKKRLYLDLETFLERKEIILKAAMAIQLKLVVDALQNTVYGPSLILGLKKYEETGSTKYFDILLDQLFYENIGELYKNLPKNEKEHAFFYVSNIVDSFNILTILRAKLLGYDPHWIRMVLAHNFYNISEERIEQMLMADDFESAFKIIMQSNYKNLFGKSEVNEEKLSKAEKEFRQVIFSNINKLRFGYPFNVGTPIAFIFRKEIELRNLIAISLGIDYNWKKDDISSLLLF